MFTLGNWIVFGTLMVIGVLITLVIGSQSSHVEGYADKATENHAHAERYAIEATRTGSHSE